MKAKKVATKQSGWSGFWNERSSTIASAIAALVIVAIGFLLFSTANQNQKVENKKQDLSAASTSTPQKVTPQPKAEEKKQEAVSPTPNPETKPQTTNVTYRVARGDSLSSIAMKFYGDGDKWTLIAARNNLSHPSLIHVGNVLVIPAVQNSEASKPSAPATPPSSNANKPSKTYTVVAGDSLWSIAENFYGNGFEWYKIRDANRSKIKTLPNGRPLLEAGTVLTIPNR